MTPEWISLQTAVIFHDLQIAEHGGSAGTRDEGALQAALARPQNLAAHGAPDLFDLATAYAYGIARSHPFVDGNKRTAFVVAGAFLELNGQELDVDEADAAITVLKLAAGSLDEAELADWLRSHCRTLAATGSGG